MLKDTKFGLIEACLNKKIVKVFNHLLKLT